MEGGEEEGLRKVVDSPSPQAAHAPSLQRALGAPQPTPRCSPTLDPCPQPQPGRSFPCTLEGTLPLSTPRWGTTALSLPQPMLCPGDPHVLSTTVLAPATTSTCKSTLDPIHTPTPTPTHTHTCHRIYTWTYCHIQICTHTAPAPTPVFVPVPHLTASHTSAQPELSPSQSRCPS